MYASAAFVRVAVRPDGRRRPSVFVLVSLVSVLVCIFVFRPGGGGCRPPGPRGIVPATGGGGQGSALLGEGEPGRQELPEKEGAATAAALPGQGGRCRQDGESILVDLMIMTA